MHPSESHPDRNLRIFGTELPCALVTGSGAPRVGRKIAEYFASHGFRIALHANSSTAEAQVFADQLNAETPQSAIVLKGPVQDENVIDSWTEQIQSNFGRLDVLVNSAAIWDPKPLETTTAADWQKCFDVNSLGTALCCQKFGLMMVEQVNGGAIINIGDWAVVRPYRDFAAYFPSKGAIESITQSMAIELATRNPKVRVNAVLPGPVKLAPNITEQKRQQIISECLLRREGSDDDVASAAMFLSFSPFITGVCLPVDGGRTIYAGPSADPVAHPDSNPS